MFATVDAVTVVVPQGLKTCKVKLEGDYKVTGALDPS